MSREIMLHATATGKAWLSTLPEVEAFRLIYAQGFPVPAGVREDSLGSNVIRSIDALRAELAATRERGYALAEHEAEAGTVALAVTFRARTDEDAPTLGTISVAGPSVRFEGPERRSWLAARLHAAAAELSAIWPAGSGSVRRSPGSGPTPASQPPGTGRPSRSPAQIGLRVARFRIRSAMPNVRGSASGQRTTRL
jgi:hypothetical protein